MYHLLYRTNRVFFFCFQRIWSFFSLSQYANGIFVEAFSVYSSIEQCIYYRNSKYNINMFARYSELVHFSVREACFTVFGNIAIASCIFSVEVYVSAFCLCCWRCMCRREIDGFICYLDYVDRFHTFKLPPEFCISHSFSSKALAKEKTCRRNFQRAHHFE